MPSIGRGIADIGNAIANTVVDVGELNQRHQKVVADDEFFKATIELNDALKASRDSLNQVQDTTTWGDVFKKQAEESYSTILKGMKSEDARKKFSQYYMAEEQNQRFKIMDEGRTRDIEARTYSYGQNLDGAVRNRNAALGMSIITNARESGLITEKVAQESAAYLKNGIVDGVAMDHIQTLIRQSGYDQAESYITNRKNEADLTDDSRNKILKYIASEKKKAEAAEKDRHSQAQKDQMEQAQNFLWENDASFQDLLDMKDGALVDLEAGDWRSLESLYNRLTAEKDGKKPEKQVQEKSAQEVQAMFFQSGVTRERILTRMNDLLDKGDLAADDYKSFYKQLNSSDNPHLNDIKSQEIISKINLLEKDEKITADEAVAYRGAYYTFLNNSWENDRFAADTNRSDEEKEQWYENHINPLKVDKIKEAIRNQTGLFGIQDDSWGYDNAEELDRAIDEGRAIGLIDHPVLARAISSGYDRDGMARFIEERLSDGRLDGFDQRDRIIRMNVEIANLAKAQKDLFSEDFRVDPKAVYVQEDGNPVMKHPNGNLYSVVVNPDTKNEEWRVWRNGMWEPFDLSKVSAHGNEAFGYEYDPTH